MKIQRIIKESINKMNECETKSEETKMDDKKETIVLELGQKILRSLDDQQTLKPEIEKDDFLATIKEMMNIIDVHEFCIGEVETEVFEISSRILRHHRASVETALAAGTLQAKVCLAATQDLQSFIRTFKDRVDKLSQDDEKNFEMICILSGILNCGGSKAKTILGEITFMSFLLDHILKSCSTIVSHSYQTFLALRTWSNRLLELSEGEVIHSNSHIATSCIRMTMSNWENPLRGVPDLVEEVLRNVLAACAKGDPKEFQDLLSSLWKSNLENISWLSKSKYPPMVVLLPRIGVEEVLASLPDFGHHLSSSLTSNHLAAAGVTVYRLILKTIDLKTWQRQFLSPLVTALTSGITLVRTNSINHWVPATIKSMSGSGDLLSSSLAKNQSDHAWVVRCLILKQERLLKSDPLTVAQLSMLREALVHISPTVRVSAFSVLSHQKKKGEAPCDQEMKMIRKFVEENLTVDSPSFRQEFTSDFTSLMIRCRNFCVANLKKNVAAVVVVTRHLDSLSKLLLTNLFPGANYQRLITSLDFLKILSLILHDYEPGGINKSSANSEPSALLEYAQSSFGLLDFYNQQNLSRLLTCTLHYMADVRKTAGELLIKFRPSRESLIETIRKGFTLACSPKYGLCESGAILLRLCQKWISEGHSLTDILKSIDFGSEPRHSLLSVNFQKSISNFNDSGNLSYFLLDLYQNLFDQLGTNFLQLARHAPMHGVLTALRSCLPACDVSSDFVERLNRMLNKSSRTMLGLLSGRRNEGEELVNASFADMGVAIESLLRGENLEEDDEDFSSDENVSISDDHSLALACTWLNLKECSIVASTLVLHFGFTMSQQEISNSGNVIQMILTLCRQKGALEGASLALADFATCLLSDPRIKHESRQIPEKMLNSVLDSLENERSVSVTRRSAGLPMFIRRIVASEPRAGGQNRRLLSLMVARLLTIVRRSDPVKSEFEDSSQAHGLHILKSLVHDGSLHHDVGLYLGDILQACVRHFNSRSWTVRNASLQLFGSLVPRLLGQKKVRSEDATHNVILMREFFSRFCHLKDCFLQNLSVQDDSCLVSPGIVPLLSLLSRVANGGDSFGAKGDDASCREFKEIFKRFWKSPVINVRRLAAKAFANFTARSQMISEIEELCLLSFDPSNGTNLNHGILCCIQEMIDLLKFERNDFFTENLETLKESVIKMSDEIKTESFVLKVQLFRICKSVEIEPSSLAETDVAKSFHPGWFEWNLEASRIKSDVVDLDDEDDNLEIQTREEGFKMIQKLTDKNSSLTPYKALYFMNRFLQSNLDSPFLSGVMLESCNEFLSENSEVIAGEAELALDLLDVPTNERIVSGKLGLGAKTSSLIVASTCFAGMLMQPDYKMFFEGGGPYVALFSEHCDALKELATPRNLETSRLHVAQALLKLLPALNMRKPGTDLDLHLRYAICQAVNATFILLSDEDTDVRQTATDFVSKLELDPKKLSETSDYFEFSRFSSLSTEKSFRKLFLFSLTELNECADWLNPIVELFFSPWNDKDALEAISVRKNRQVLFESGEGLNVYEEPVACNESYFDTFAIWAKHNLSETPIKLNLNLESGLESVRKFVQHSELQAGPFSDLRTPPGHLMLVRSFNFLKLIESFPEILYDKSKYDKEKISEMISMLNRHLYAV